MSEKSGKNVFDVFPLSFREFMVFKGFEYGYGGAYLIEKDISVIKEMLREYITFGGFPEVVLAQAESNKEELVQTLFVDIVSRDIFPRLKRKGEIAEEIAYFLLLERQTTKRSGFCFERRFENKAAHSGNLRFKQGRDRDEGKESVDKSE